MFIRSVRLTDLATLGRLRQHTLRLGLPASQVSHHTPLAVAALSLLPSASGLRTFVLGERQPLAYLQMIAPPRAHRWELLHLAGDVGEVAEADNEPDHPWLLLLNYAAITAGRRRVTRLLAKVPETADSVGFLRQAAYQVYGREQVFSYVYSAADRLVEAGLSPRAQRPSDDWLIHRLYFQTAPRTVQDAEATTSHHWELRTSRPTGPRERGWLLEVDSEVVAYIRTLSGRRTHLVECLFLPQQRELLPRLARQVLANLPAAPGDRIFWSLGEHQSEAAETLIDMGFTVAGAQALMVRYLAVKVPARERLFKPAKLVKPQRLAIPEAGRRSGIVPRQDPGGESMPMAGV